MKKGRLQLVLFILIGFFSYGQNLDERREIIEAVDLNSFNEFKSSLELKKASNDLMIENYLLSNPLDKSLRYGQGELFLERIDRFNRPVFLKTYNFGGAFAIGANKLHNGGDLGLNIEGQGITAAIWDGGYSRQTHEEFSNRVVYGEEGKIESDHGTHVAGTIISQGISVTNRGMAPQGRLISYRFDDDAVEMLNQASNGILLSNHSYGADVDEETPIFYYGKYDGSAMEFDRITSLFKYYLPVVSAGNDRGSGLNRFDNNYDLLTDRSLSKNVITVGAVNASLYRGPRSVTMSSFSSFGPPDDGRIKPDLVAKGVNVLSLGSDSDTDTGRKSGTSMSAPMVTGGLMLLHQLYNQQHSGFMKSATIKGLALMTANITGKDRGPDYEFGWGLLNVEAAANVIIGLNESSFISEETLVEDKPYTQTFSSVNTDELSFALSWTDLPSEFFNDIEDDTTPMLINDLDLKVVSSDGTEYFPYKLDPARPEAAATNGINNVDNIEIIHINAPAGNYQVVITHKGSITGESQDFSLIVKGATPATATSDSQELNGLSIYPNPANGTFNITFDAGLDANTVNVEVFNTLGQKVKNATFNNSGNFNERINVSDLSSGIYLVKVGNASRSSTRKLVIR